MTDLARAQGVVEAAHEGRVFSAAVAEVGTSGGAVWELGHGRLSWDPGASPVSTETVFDLASLTKVLATASAALCLVARGRLGVDEPVADILESWGRADRTMVRVRDLLDHSSGLPAHRPYYQRCRGRAAFDAAIAAEPLDYPPRTQSVYSDLGFIALGFALEQRADATLDAQFNAWCDAASIAEAITFVPPATWQARIAQTEIDPWRGRVLQGEVHDENAAALDGVAGHAGLFGTARAVGACARWWLRLLRGHDDPSTGVTAAQAAAFAARSTVAGSSRALGWDTMLPTSSCGTRMSARAVGHTGFTGTSLWIDPATDRYVVLLTNRVHPTRATEGIQEVRRAFHDAVDVDLAGGWPLVPGV